MADQLLTFMPAMLGVAVLLPLASFFVILAFGTKLGKNAAYLATAAIVGAGLLSFICLFAWLGKHYPQPSHGEHGGEPAHAAADAHGHSGTKHDDDAADATHANSGADKKPAYTGTYWLLGQFGKLQVTISYYIDSLTLVMFCMVTLIASCIHFYAIGYMHDELHDVTDHEVTLRSGQHLHRPGRFHRLRRQVHEQLAVAVPLRDSGVGLERGVALHLRRVLAVGDHAGAARGLDLALRLVAALADELERPASITVPALGEQRALGRVR